MYYLTAFTVLMIPADWQRNRTTRFYLRLYLPAHFSYRLEALFKRSFAREIIEIARALFFSSSKPAFHENLRD